MKDVNIRYYFDGEQRPRIDVGACTFFSSENPIGIFCYPLAVDGGGVFRLLHSLMFFKKRLKVTLSHEPVAAGSDQIPWTGRYEKIPKCCSRWYKYTFHTFAEHPGIQSGTLEQDESALFSCWGNKEGGH
jgi:hypothetical protein